MSLSHRTALEAAKIKKKSNRTGCVQVNDDDNDVWERLKGKDV